MKKILIVGAGGHGQVVAEVAEDLGYQVAFLDDNSHEAIGRIDDMERFLQYENAFCGIGNNQFRESIMYRLEKAGFTIPCLIHPSAYVSKSAIIEKGVVVEPKAIVNANTIVKEGSIISVGSIVDHNVVIGRYAHINAGAIVKAGATIEDYRKLEAGEVVLGYEAAIVHK